MYNSEPLYEGLKACSAGQEGSGNKSHVFLVETAASLHLRPISLRPVVFYTTMNVSTVGIEVVMKAMWQLVHFLLIIMIIAPASMRAWRASIVVGVSFIVATGTSVEIWFATLMLRAFVVLMLASTITMRVMVAC
jgi:hypothetical protein